jgi:hypothetical protein
MQLGNATNGRTGPSGAMKSSDLWLLNRESGSETPLSAAVQGAESGPIGRAHFVPAST